MGSQDTMTGWITKGVLLGLIALSGCVLHTRPRATVVAAAPPVHAQAQVQVATGQVIYTAPPPPQQVVVAQPAAPYAGAVWVAGHWEWNGAQHVWIQGHYIQPRAGHVYVQPRWERRGQGWVYVQGSWNRGGRRPTVRTTTRTVRTPRATVRVRPGNTTVRTTTRTNRRGTTVRTTTRNNRRGTTVRTTTRNRNRVRVTGQGGRRTTVQVR